MQDRTPTPFALVVCEWLNARFPRKRMSRRGSHEWPAKSPDLTVNTLTYFFIWGCSKEQVYSTKSRHLEELEGRIREILTHSPSRKSFL